MKTAEIKPEPKAKEPLSLYQPSLSGGEIPEPLRSEYLNLRQLILKEKDVIQLLNLAGMADGGFLYLIQTPFATFPKYVIGTTDKDNEHVEILFQSGAEWSAQAAWNRLRHGKEIA